jgi:hypothetical protein
MNRNGAMLRTFGSGLLLAGVLAGSASAQGSLQFDGQYTGELTLRRTMRGDCMEPPPGAVYPLTISGGQVRFAYVPRFATTLVGAIDDKGRFKAIARARKGTVQMAGRIDGNRVTATILSPSCTYAFQTK